MFKQQQDLQLGQKLFQKTYKIMHIREEVTLNKRVYPRLKKYDYCTYQFLAHYYQISEEEASEILTNYQFCKLIEIFANNYKDEYDIYYLMQYMGCASLLDYENIISEQELLQVVDSLIQLANRLKDFQLVLTIVQVILNFGWVSKQVLQNAELMEIIYIKLREGKYEKFEDENLLSIQNAISIYIVQTQEVKIKYLDMITKLVKYKQDFVKKQNKEALRDILILEQILEKNSLS